MQTGSSEPVNVRTIMENKTKSGMHRANGAGVRYIHQRLRQLIPDAIRDRLRILSRIPPSAPNPDQSPGRTFSEVFQYEMDGLAADGRVPSEQGSAEDAIARARRMKLTGLALSGGGIRSATFNLGVIQALAEKKLLREFDYLSTVSGGGYIGAWLSRLIREHGGGVEKVEDILAPKNADAAPGSEPRAIRYLRRYSNYLAPKTGLLSADTWTLLITYFRNTALNMAMLTAWLACLFLLPRILAWMVADALAYCSTSLYLVAAGLALVSLFFAARSLSRKGKAIRTGWFSQTQGWVLATVCLPLCGAALIGSMALWKYQHVLTRFWEDFSFSSLQPAALWLLLPGFLYFAAWSGGWISAAVQNRGDTLRGHGEAGEAGVLSWRSVRREGPGHLLCAMGTLAGGTVLLLTLLSAHAPRDGSWLSGFGIVALATFGMPALLLLFGLTITLMIGLLGHLYSDQSREWWARMGAWLVIIVTVWTSLFCCAFYLPPVLMWAFFHHPTLAHLGGLAGALMTIFGVRAGSFPKTGSWIGKKTLGILSRIAPFTFCVLIIAAISALVEWSLAGTRRAALQPASLEDYINTYTMQIVPVGPLDSYTSYFVISALKPLAFFGFAAFLLGTRVDINQFSLYMMYRLRLVRAYLGASNLKRSPHPFTGFDPADDPELASLNPQAAGSKEGAPALQKPYHIINTTLNLVNGKDLAWQNRKAANFVFTPGFCGFEIPPLAGDEVLACVRRGAFRPTAQYASMTTLEEAREAITLGAAVAVSGAAASPNMGYHSSPQLAFLMTLFNLRLGRWCPNPAKTEVWRCSSPRVPLLSILAELFGLTTLDAPFLYLSDGGHFENLGLYELVRCRCRLILVVDASADGSGQFDDLGNAIRKCSIDFNIPIELDPRGIGTADRVGGTGASFVTGKIRYRQADGRGRDGVLLYIKPSIIGNENADVFNYHRMHPDFPHQSTADQFFDENQFESYRSLGYQTAMSALSHLDRLQECRPSWTGALRRYRVERMCTLLGLEAPARGRRKKCS